MRFLPTCAPTWCKVAESTSTGCGPGSPNLAGRTTSAGMPDPAVGQGRQGHPDERWLARIRSALDAWEQSPGLRPTSSVLGGGAVAAAEAVFSEHHNDRPALLLPSATYALRVSLQVLGVGAGDEVICAAVDWQAGADAAASL